jgi:hypothetical protein
MEYKFHPQLLNSIEEKAAALKNLLQPITLAENRQLFANDVAVSATITDKDLADSPVIRGCDVSGRGVIVFIFLENRVCYGLIGDDCDKIKNLADEILKAKWAKSCISREFIESEIIKFLRYDYFNSKKESIAEWIIKESARSVRKYVCWCPVAYLIVESEFKVGPVTVAPMTKAFLDKMLEDHARHVKQDDIEEFEMYKVKMRKELQGYAAVVYEIEAERGRANELCLSIAADVVGMLRFFSPAAWNYWLLCPNSLLGSELVPRSTTILQSGDSNFGVIRKAYPDVLYWNLSSKTVSKMELEGLRQAGRLVIENEVNEFQRRVRTSILTFSKGTTIAEISDRLVYTISSLECLLLRDENESIQQNIGERMAFLIAKEPSARMRVVANLKEAYRMRSKYIHHQVTSLEEDRLSEFYVNARVLFQIVLNNADRFETTSDFISSIEKLKFS